MKIRENFTNQLARTIHGWILIQYWPEHPNGFDTWPALWSATRRDLLPDQIIHTFGTGDTAKEALANCCRSIDYYNRRAEGRL